MTAYRQSLLLCVVALLFSIAFGSSIRQTTRALNRKVARGQNKKIRVLKPIKEEVSGNEPDQRSSKPKVVKGSDTTGVSGVQPGSESESESESEDDKGDSKGDSKGDDPDPKGSKVSTEQSETKDSKSVSSKTGSVSSSKNSVKKKSKKDTKKDSDKLTPDDTVSNRTSKKGKTANAIKFMPKSSVF